MSTEPPGSMDAESAPEPTSGEAEGSPAPEQSMSLLKKAKSMTARRRKAEPPSEQEIELVLALTRKEITLTQAAYALGVDNGSAWHKVMRIVQLALESGALKLVRPPTTRLRL